MPLYDFRCSAGHTFEKNVPMADRDLEIPCEYYEKVTQMDPSVTCSNGDPMDIDLVATKYSKKYEVLCPCTATRIFSHNNPRSMLDHGMATNRDAAREGRYDPLNPSTKGMGSGRSWRK